MIKRRNLLVAGALTAMVAPFTAGLPLAHAEQAKAQLMFVQTALFIDWIGVGGGVGPGFHGVGVGRRGIGWR